jgi:hypothetical protein
MIRLGTPLRFEATKAFFSLPLAQAREASVRVAAAVMAQSSEVGELLDERGNEVLCVALARELPTLSKNDLFALAAEVNGTAHMIATVEWRDAGHRPGDSPAIGLSTLEGALLIHLHATPKSVPAQIRAASWKEHADLYKHRFMRRPKLTKETMGPWAQLHREHDQSMYGSWQELRAQP